MKRIALVGFTGWAGIVWLAWHLAEARIDACRYSEGWTCALRATAARDTTLTNGLTVALLALLTLMLVTVLPDQRARLSRLRPTLPTMLNSARPRRWLIGVAVAAALASVVCFIAIPGQRFATSVVPAGVAAVEPSDDVTDVAPGYTYPAGATEVGTVAGDTNADAAAPADVKDSASEDIVPAVD